MNVSVVVPAYNRGYIIKDALQSVFDQTFTDYELIVVDDGSSDNTADTVASFHDHRVRYIRHERNKGCAAAYNTGFAAARGRLISILDSDDLWKPRKLELETTFLAQHPEVQAVFSDLEKVDGNSRTASFMRTTPVFGKKLGSTVYPGGLLLTQREMYLCLLQEVPIKPTALIMRADALRAVGDFDESWPSANDWDFLLRFAKMYQFGYIDCPLAVLRVQSDATHRLHAERNHMFVLDFLRRQRKLVCGDREAEVALCSGISDTTKHLAWHYLDVDRKSDAARILLRGFRETGHLELLSRAIATALPMPWRQGLKHLLGRSRV